MVERVAYLGSSERNIYQTRSYHDFWILNSSETC